MYGLIVEENVSAERFQHLALLHASQEEGFVDAHVPGTKCADHPLAGLSQDEFLEKLKTLNL